MTMLSKLSSSHLPRRILQSVNWLGYPWAYIFREIPQVADVSCLQSTDRTNRPGAFVATGSRDKTIKLWDASTGQILRNLVSYSHSFSLYSKTIALNTAQVGHDNWIRALVFHPTGKFLLSASDDKTIRVWDLATGRCTKTVDAHAHFVTCLAWGRQLAGGGGEGADGSANGAQEAKLVNVVASGSVDQTVKIWLP
jgi:platelet-activating factor acetylhydrolase IB subunit alpha